MGRASQLPNRNRPDGDPSRLDPGKVGVAKLGVGPAKLGVVRGARSGTKVMQCFFCHAWNDEDVPRCVRCGRRVPPPAGKSSYPFMSAMAGALNVDPVVEPQPELPAAAPTFGTEFPASMPAQESVRSAYAAATGRGSATANFPASASFATAANRIPEIDLDVKMQAPVSADAAHTMGTQPWLFRAGEIGRPKVVPIPVLTPRVEPIPRKPRAPRDQTARVHRKANSRPSELQHLLDLQEAAGEQPSRPSLDAVIDCDAAVAPTVQRVAGAMVDGGIVLAAVVLFFSMFYLAGGALGLDKQTVLLVLSSSLLFGLLYRALWCLGGGDTPGTRSAGMRVVNFDGRSPDRAQRGRRMAAGLLSLFSVGLGLVWVLVDEERLSWHDHISKTFPTPV